MAADVIDIRPGVATDARAMAIMSRDLVEHGLGWSWRSGRILRMMQHPECVVLAAKVKRKLVGFAAMEFHAYHGHLSLLAVDPGFRRLGVAHQLLDWLTLSARVAGLQKLELEVRENNKGAIQFYQRSGYESVKLIKGYYQQRENAVQMRRQLVPEHLPGQQP